MRPGLRQAAPIFLASVVLALAGAALAESDTQLWSEVKLTAKWTDRFDLIAANSLRFGEDVSRLDRSSWLLGVNLHAIPQATLTPGYQYIVNDPADDVSSFEHRFGVVAAVRLPFERCEGTFSTGLEYRLRHDQPDGWRVRPRFQLKRAFGPDTWGVAAYVADELFYDTRADGWTRNRLFAGLEKKMRRNWVLDLSYCRQHALRTRDLALNIIGISMPLSLDNSASDSSMDLPVH